jgi:mannosyltransferase OCH1-like enzyme
MVSRKNSVFWDLIIKEMKLKPVFSTITKHTEIMWTTGPMMISNAVKKYGKDKVVAIDTKLLSDCSLCDSEEICKEKSLYIVDQHESSWHSSDSSFFNSVYCAFN